MDINKAAQKNKTDVALEIMELSRRTLLLHLRFMDVALCSLDLREYRGSFAVDGQSIWFDPEHVKAADTYVRPYVKLRVCLDYEL